MNLFNQLNHRYGQSCIKEVRSWEGKEQKLARHKCHLHFNLRCLSQNIVPKGVKLNIKQFSMFQERKIMMASMFSSSCQHIYGIFWEHGTWTWIACTHKGLEKICRWCVQHNPQGKLWQFVKISKFHWSTHKIYHWTTKCWGWNPLFGHIPQATRRRHSGSSLQKANPHRQIPGLQLQPPCFGQKSCGKSLNG